MSGWSGATPERTSPKGVGKRSCIQVIIGRDSQTFCQLVRHTQPLSIEGGVSSICSATYVFGQSGVGGTQLSAFLHIVQVSYGCDGMDGSLLFQQNVTIKTHGESNSFGIYVSRLIKYVHNH